MLSKARADLEAARLLAQHDDQDDGVVGFHAQQACEKALKSVLAITAQPIPRTHDLEALRERLDGGGIRVPDALAGMAWLTAWAVLMRYEEVDLPLDRVAAVELADAVIAWAAERLER